MFCFILTFWTISGWFQRRVVVSAFFLMKLLEISRWKVAGIKVTLCQSVVVWVCPCLSVSVSFCCSFNALLRLFQTSSVREPYASSAEPQVPVLAEISRPHTALLRLFQGFRSLFSGLFFLVREPYASSAEPQVPALLQISRLV
jgi:hypothetical protein